MEVDINDENSDTFNNMKETNYTLENLHMKNDRGIDRTVRNDEHPPERKLKDVRFRRLAASALMIAAVVMMMELSAAAEGQAAVDTSSQAIHIESQADQILHSMSDYLVSINQFAFSADVRYGASIVDGRIIELGGILKVMTRRPDQLRAEFNGDERMNRIIFDGKTATFWDKRTNAYAVTQVPTEIGAAMDLMFDKYGYSVPVADFLYSNPYAVLMEHVKTGIYLGKHNINSIPCHHLSFIQENIDWQIWIEDGTQPLPKRLLITYKTEPGTPIYAATLTWDISGTEITDASFQFNPPEGATEMEFLGAAKSEEQE